MFMLSSFLNIPKIFARIYNVVKTIRYISNVENSATGIVVSTSSGVKSDLHIISTIIIGNTISPNTPAK